MHPSQKLIAVAIDRDRGSQIALKFAVEHLLNKGHTLHLLHVKLRPPTTNPRPSCNPGQANGEMDSQTKELFIPFRVFCSRKDIQCQDIVIEETDVVRGIAEYVRQSAIEILVIGSPARGSLFRFKMKDIPGAVMKGVPDFCTVYVISKGKIASTRSASRAAPAVNPIRNQILHQAGNASRSSTPFPESSSHGRTDSTTMKSPSTCQKGPNSRSNEYSSAPENDSSFGRPGVDSQIPSFSDDLVDGPTLPRLSDLPDMDNRSSDSMNIGHRSVDSVTPPKLSFVSLDNDSSMPNQMEAEIIRLKQKLKQTTEMYNTACKEALHANQKPSDMSASSSSSQKKMTMDLRFKPVQCRCKKDVPLRIAQYLEDTKGWLYFKCCKCRFFSWCIPDRATWMASGLSIIPPERTIVDDDLVGDQEVSFQDDVVGEQEVNFQAHDEKFMSMVMEINGDMMKMQSEIMRKMHKLLIVMGSLAVVIIGVVALK